MNDWIFFGRGEVDCAEYLAVICEVNRQKLRAEAKRLRRCTNLHVQWMEDEQPKERAMGGRYSIRKPGCTAYATTNNPLVAQRLCREANRIIATGYLVVDNKHEAFLATHLRDNKADLSQ